MRGLSCIIAAGAILLISGCGSSRPIQINIDNNRPTINGIINGEAFAVLMDTGMTDSCGISEDIANKLGLKRLDVIGTVTFGDGSSRNAVYSSDTVEIDFGGLTISIKCPVIFFGTNNNTVVLGTQCFVQTDAIIDYGKRTIVFHPRK